MLWETNSTAVRPVPLSSSIRPRHFFWNEASPTASTSSTSRISGSRCVRPPRTPGACTSRSSSASRASPGTWPRSGELDDLVEAPLHLRSCLMPMIGGRQHDVPPAGQLEVAGADLSSNEPTRPWFPLARGRRRDAREDLEQRALAGAVPPDDPNGSRRPRSRTRRPSAPRSLASRVHASGLCTRGQLGDVARESERYRPTPWVAPMR